MSRVPPSRASTVCTNQRTKIRTRKLPCSNCVARFCEIFYLLLISLYLYNSLLCLFLACWYCASNRERIDNTISIYFIKQKSNCERKWRTALVVYYISFVTWKEVKRLRLDLFSGCRLPNLNRITEQLRGWPAGRKLLTCWPVLSVQDNSTSTVIDVEGH